MYGFEIYGLFVALPVLALILIGGSSGTRQTQRRKEMEHLERIKAMEMGVIPEPGGLDWPTAAVCIAIGAGVPVGSFAIGWLASLNPRAPQIIWVAAAIVSFSAISAARKLASRSIDPRSRSKGLAGKPSGTAGKPEFDPDAFDVVSRRG